MKPRHLRRWSIPYPDGINSEVAAPLLRDVGHLICEDDAIVWRQRITGHQFRRLREKCASDPSMEHLISGLIDGMIAVQEDRQTKSSFGRSGPATRWGEVQQAVSEGISSDTWVRMLERYREVIMRVIHKYGAQLPAVVEVPSFEGFLSWFCQSDRLERIRLRTEDGHVNAFRSWLAFQVRSYLNYTSMRSRKQATSIEELEGLDWIADYDAQPHGHGIDEDAIRAFVADALKILKDESEDAYDSFLFRSKKLSGIEVAALLGCSEATVSRRFNSALDIFRRLITARFGPDCDTPEMLFLAQVLAEVPSKN